MRVSLPLPFGPFSPCPSANTSPGVASASSDVDRSNSLEPRDGSSASDRSTGGEGVVRDGGRGVSLVAVARDLLSSLRQVYTALFSIV